MDSKKIDLYFRGQDVKKIAASYKKGYVLVKCEIDKHTLEVSLKVAMEAYDIENPKKSVIDSATSPNETVSGCPTPPCKPENGESLSEDCAKEIASNLKIDNFNDIY